MSYHGDIRLGDTIDIQFSTRNTSGVPTTLAGTPAISAYIGNSTTQITSGITLTVDLDSVTGLHNCRVVASGGNGFATATNVSLVITTGTVGGTSVVGEQIGSFSIENRSALMPTTATRTLDVSSTGEAGIDWANVGSPTTTLNLSGTTVKNATDVLTDTANIKTRLPAALVSGRIDSSVGAMATDVLTSTALASSAVTEIQSGLSTLDAAGVRTAVGLASANLDTQLTTIGGYIDTEVAAIKAKTDNLPSDPADASDIAAAFSTVNSSLGTIAGYIDTEIAAIKAKTDALPSDPADASDIAASFATVNSTLTTIAGYIDTEVSAIKAKTDNLPSDPADASDIASSFSTVNGTLATIAGYIDTEVAAIKAKTDNIPAAPAAVSDIPTAAANADAVWDEARSGHTTSGTFGESFGAIEAGQCVTGTLSTTQATTNLTEATNDHYIGRTIVWLTGVLTRQASAITDYDGATKTLTYTAVTEAPANGDRFILV